MLSAAFLIAGLRLLVVLGLAGGLVFLFYRILNRSPRFQKFVDPDGPSVLDEAKDVAKKATKEKSVMKAAEDQLRQDRDQLEEYFPENRGKKSVWEKKKRIRSK